LHRNVFKLNIKLICRAIKLKLLKAIESQTEQTEPIQVSEKVEHTKGAIEQFAHDLDTIISLLV